MDLRNVLLIVLPFVAAGLAALCIYLFVRNIRIESSAERRVTKLMGDQLGVLDRYGDSAVDRMGLSLDSWKNKLKWAHMGGKLLDWSVGGIFARAVVYGGGFALVVLFFKMPPMYLIAALIAAYYPLMHVGSEAESVQKIAKRMLPELATVIAAEMGAGGAAEVALSRAARMPGPLGIILNEALNEAKASSRPLFRSGTVQGVLVEVFSRQGLPELARFGAQIDRVASKGVEASRVMNEIARGFARDYKSNVTRASAQLDSQLLFPMSLFFFLPFIAAILVPVFFMLLDAF